ncbi:von Willebrand factor type A domain-containing protein [Pacmanvirus A23]|uniref:von Willebrand factor type A domain-containing protein n=1 Tax=Pacmanvirus A23 TaxID=1932881 RepID=UPI000A0933B3|nr:von Willebrand factor type A domain-containing protein [Pacmanvirus A23]SIP86038.1 von Willebrand factor type A domain-containing protein [Pacmanvirus A23]
MKIKIHNNDITIKSSCETNYASSDSVHNLQAVISIIGGKSVPDNKIQKVALVIALDISLSMRGKKMSTVKSIIKYLFENLSSSCYISIILFNDSPINLTDNLQQTTSENLTMIYDKLLKIKPSGGTNLTDTLILMVNQISVFKETNNQPVEALLFTDGCHNVGSTWNLAKQVIRDRLEEYTFPINNFTVGSQTESKKLLKIANMTAGGYYKHIENIEEISTTFGSYIGLLKSRISSDISIRLKAKSGSRISSVVGIDTMRYVNKTAKDITYYIGGLSTEQQRTLLINLSIRGLTSEELKLLTYGEQLLVKIKISMDGVIVTKYLKVNRVNRFTNNISNEKLVYLYEAVLKNKMVICLEEVAKYVEFGDNYNAELVILETISDLTNYLGTLVNKFAVDSINELKNINTKLHNILQKSTLCNLISSHSHQQGGRYETFAEVSSSEDIKNYVKREQIKTS